SPIESNLAAQKLKKVTKLDDRPILFFRIGKQKKKLIKSPRYFVDQIIIK
ncbi:MAG: hypothetical protein ACD_18C00038G0002, partial [uncultured bacterium]